MNKIYHANYQSRNFDFDAFGLTKEDARATLMKGLLKHTKQFNLEPDWFYEDDISIQECELDKPYRDRSIIK